MERGKYRTIFASLAGGLWMLLVVGLSLAAGSASPRVQSRPRLRLQRLHPGRGCTGAKTAARISRRRVRIRRSRRMARSDRRRIRCLGDAGRRRQGRHSRAS